MPPKRTTRKTSTNGQSANGHDAEDGGGVPVLGFIEPIEIQEEMERSFIEYSMSVIVSRALPDVRDGLKPVHRRILYSMFDQGLRPDRPHVKCAEVVGRVMGTYHPHGDSAIYDALVRMVQEFSMRLPLIDGHGNFGGTGPDEGPAAMRYTECRLHPLALELMAGIDEETVNFVPNYSNAAEEPVVRHPERRAGPVQLDDPVLAKLVGEQVTQVGRNDLAEFAERARYQRDTCALRGVLGHRGASADRLVVRMRVHQQQAAFHLCPSMPGS